jgi:hypothetical protein
LGEVVFSTANGSAPAKGRVRLQVPGLDEIIDPYILADTPAVLSVGRRCRAEGYSFIWLNGYKPVFTKILPNGKLCVICLDVIGDIPYLRPDAPILTGARLQDSLAREYGVTVHRNKLAIANHPHFASIADMERSSIFDMGQNDKSSRVKISVKAAPSELDMVEQMIELDAMTGGYPSNNLVADAVSLRHVDPYKYAPICHACGVRGTDFKDWQEYVKSTSHNYEHRSACTKYCDSCMRGMTRAIRHVPGRSNRVIEKFGDVVTLDHVDMLSELAQEGPGIGVL